MEHRPFHILMADDDEDDQFLLADTFRFFPKKLQFTSARNGIELMSMLEFSCQNGDTLPGAIILDINMPLMDGMEALKRIKADTRLRHIPVYMVTTLRNMEKLEECLEHGAASFFTKPNHTKEYVKIVSEILEGVNEHSKQN